MKCKYCNSELRRGAKFCSNCGKEVADIIHKEEMVLQEKEAIKEIEKPQNVVMSATQNVNCPIAEPQSDNVADTLEPYESKRSSKKWIWILGVILLICIIGGGWFFLNDNQAPEVGNLTAYYAKEDFRVNEHEYKKGVLICDSNDPLNHVSDEDENNYRYSGDDGGEEYSWLLPKSKVEKKVYTMNQLAPSDISRKVYFKAENGCVARIFWSNSNGHRFYNWNGKEEKYNEEERYKECFVLSAELLSPWDNSKYLFEEQLNEKSGYIELYCENKYRQLDHPIGFIEESWCNKEGYDFKKSAYDKDGKLLVDQWEIDGIPDYISIAYIADEDALYINGILYYLREESSEASDSEII